MSARAPSRRSGPSSGYVPERGDLVWLDFQPSAGHEQTGRRPALVLSSRGYNAKTSLALLCPITSQEKGYPFEVRIPDGLDLGGVVLSDQLKSLDWRARRVKHAGRLSDAAFREVAAKATALISG